MKQRRIRNLKRKTKHPTYYRKKCVEKAKIIAKDRANWTCEHCGRTKEQGWQMHGSHILPEGTYVSMSADPENILCLCAKCHVGGGPWKNKSVPSWHEDPMYFADWFEKKWPGRYQALRKKAQVIKVVNWKKRFEEITSWLDSC